MGNNPSKPTEHIFYGETPVQFSHNLLSTIEGSSESDSTRQKTTDLHIAQLVHSELQRIKSREDQILAKLSTTSTSTSTTDEIDDPLALSRNSLAQKIAEIKYRLESIPGGGNVGEEDDEVKRARGEVVRCLRGNDRRPLDCLGEVQAFMEVARRREGRFVAGIVGR